MSLRKRSVLESEIKTKLSNKKHSRLLCRFNEIKKNITEDEILEHEISI